MSKPVMVALDGSEKDGRATAVATAIGRLADAGLHFVQVLASPDDDARRETETRLVRMAAGVPDDGARVPTTAVLHHSDVAAALIEHAGDRDALLIVLATRAADAKSRAIAGSVADRVMRDSPRPVVLVPPGAAFLAGKTAAIGRVMVPMDDSSLSFRSLEFLIGLPHAKELAYVLLEVIADERTRDTVTRRLENSANWLRSRGARNVEVRAVHAPEPASAIVAGVREVLADAIVMSTRGAGGLGRLVLGSVAEGVVRKSELPVMLLTPRMLAAVPGRAA
jgi:nucleotide-binding universal stress UspA family protein